MSSIPPATLTKARQGDAGCQTSIGRMYEKGENLKQDYAEAANWYRKSADQGDENAQYWLAQLYREGHGVELDNAEAYFWELIAEKSNLEDPYSPDHAYYAKLLSAENILAIQHRVKKWKPTLSALEEGRTAYRRKEYQRAFKLLQPLAAEENAEAQNALAFMYSNGWGIEKNDKEAENWFAAANKSIHRMAEYGDQLAQLMLCDMHLRGTPNIKQNYEEAYFWLCLARAHRSGFGVSKEILELPDNLSSEQKAKVDKRVREWKPATA